MRKAFWVGLAVVSVAAPALADMPEGWHLARDGAACEADYPQDKGPQAEDGTMLTVAVIPPQHLLLLENPAFPAERQTHIIGLSFDGGPLLTMESLGSDRIYGIAITPDIGMGLRSGSHLTVALDGKRFEYRYAHADRAMDEAAHCAGTKTLPEVWNDAPKPIASAPGWGILEGIGGTNQCTVRRNSPEVNTSLVLTKQGRLVLIAGRPDWAKWGNEIKATLKIDADAPIAVAAAGVQNLVLLPLTDDTVVKRLQTAKMLRWHLPWGDFTAEVEGLGAAETVLRACDAKNAKPAPKP